MTQNNQTAYLDIADVLGIIRRACRATSQKEFAQQCGVSAPFVSDVLSAKRAPTDKVLAAVGVRKMVLYQTIGE